MSRRQEKIWNNPIAQEYNGKYGIGLGLCYKIIMTFGDSEYSHDFCKWLMNLRKEKKTWTSNWDDLCIQFNLSKISKYNNYNN